MKGVFGDNIRGAILSIKKGGQKVEFSICGHPELYPTMWGQEKPEPARSVGGCPVHDYVCPVCGYGAGQSPSCDCPEKRY